VLGPVVSLNTVWFSLIGLLWAGYFVLEGFDFGVAILAPILSTDDVDRRLCLNAIGPFWDGNEVWLIVAGGATFAAFPAWYATMFSAFYVALFLILVALIVRGVAFEFRAKRGAASWRRTWDTALFLGSLVPALLWGVAFVDLVRGTPVASGPVFVGGFSSLVQPVALLGGLASLSLFLAQGAVFLSLKTTGLLRRRARRAGGVAAGASVPILLGTLVWVGASMDGSARPGALPGGVPALLVTLALFALGATVLALVIAAASAAVFTALFPRVMVSSLGAAESLTIWNAASAHETLFVMTIVAAIFTPFVLLYQGWSYWVFRQRLTRPPGESWAGGGSGRPVAPSGSLAVSGVAGDRTGGPSPSRGSRQAPR